MATVSLDAQLRTTTGKGAARKARAAGSLPAVVYRAGLNATPISIDPEAIEIAFLKTGDRNTLIELEIAGDGKRTCLVREAQRNPSTRRLEHVDFFEVTPDDVVTVTVKMNPVGTAVGTKLGGRLQVIRRTLDVRCKPAFIPSTVDVDVSEMEVNTFIRASQVVPPTGCELVFDTDFNVVAVLGKRVETGKPGEA